jgi:hypothetical protein
MASASEEMILKKAETKLQYQKNTVNQTVLAFKRYANQNLLSELQFLEALRVLNIYYPDVDDPTKPLFILYDRFRFENGEQ